MKLRLLLLLFVFSAVNASATKYYVNDASRTGDIFCSAVGSSSNNGTSASQQILLVLCQTQFLLQFQQELILIY